MPCVLVNPRVPVATRDVFGALGMRHGELLVGATDVIESSGWPDGGASVTDWVEALEIVPNDLEAFFVPFTPNRAFKKAPRLILRAKDMHYYTPEGKPILDGSAGMWCCNAGHNRPPIVAAIQSQAGELDYPPAFQFSHPKAFELASRIANFTG